MEKVATSDSMFSRLDLVIVGAAKAGTTSLESILSDMGNTVKVAPRKPIFGNRAVGELKAGALETIAAAPSEAFLFHVRADYMSDPAACREIASCANAHIVLLCRDPSQRLWSHYYHDYKKGRSNTQDGFEKWLRSERGRRAYELSEYGKSCLLLREIFGTESVHILLTEDLNDFATLNALFKKLGLRLKDNLPARRENVSRMPRNVAVMQLANRIIEPMPRGILKRTLIRFRNRYLTVSKQAPKMPASIRQKLAADFHQDIALFEQLSGRDVSRWRA